MAYWRIQIDDKWIMEAATIKQSQCQQIDILFAESKRKYFPPLYQTISQIKFPFLKRIDLSRLGIQSVEGLPFLNMQMMRELNLAGNRITSIKSIDKIKWSNLSMIKFQYNYIPNINLQRVKLNTQMQEIGISYENDIFPIKKSQIQIHDLAVLMKAQPTFINIIYLYNERDTIMSQLKILKLVGKSNTMYVLCQPGLDSDDELTI